MYQLIKTHQEKGKKKKTWAKNCEKQDLEDLKKMEIQERKKLYIKLWLKNGRQNQLLKAIEEAGEFTTAVSRFMTFDSLANGESLIDEVADMEIMLEQIKQRLHMTDLVERRKISKIKRLKSRVKNNEFEKKGRNKNGK